MPDNRTCLSDKGSNQLGRLESSCGSRSNTGDRATSMLLWTVVRIPPSLRGSVDFFTFGQVFSLP
jgi:hypothetical protein